MRTGPGFPYKSAIIYGLGHSGKAAKRLLEQVGLECVVVDDSRPSGDCPLSADPAVVLDPRLHGGDRKRSDRVLILSPGIPRTKPLVQDCIAHNIPILNEIEVAAHFIPNCHWIGITGTNGKSTVTALLGEMLKSWDPTAFVGGNLGRPLCEAIADGESPKIGVLELSSYQLETITPVIPAQAGIHPFQLDVAAITNLAPDHLDRYPSIEAYYAAKLRIFELIKRDREAEKQRGRELGMSNLDLATACAREFGVPKAHIRAGIERFKGLPHRMEILGEHDGVLYINDSKATNIAATNWALSSVDRPIHLILGGQSKGLHWQDINIGFSRPGSGSGPGCGGNPSDPIKLKAIYAIGETADEIRAHFHPKVQTHPCYTLENAVKMARAVAKKGDVILLSPACASFDQFANFEARGEMFKSQINSPRV